MFFTVTHTAVVDILVDKSFHPCCIISLDRSRFARGKEYVFLSLVIHRVKLSFRKVVEIVILGCSVNFSLCSDQSVFVNILTTGAPSFNASFYQWLISIVIKQWSQWKWFPENSLKCCHNFSTCGVDLLLLKSYVKLRTQFGFAAISCSAPIPVYTNSLFYDSVNPWCTGNYH